MQVRFRNPARDTCPVAETVMVPPSQTFLTPNKVYEAFAVSVYKSEVILRTHRVVAACRLDLQSVSQRRSPVRYGTRVHRKESAILQRNGKPGG